MAHSTEDFNSTRIKGDRESGMNTELSTKGEPNLIENEFLGQHLRYLGEVRTRRGVNLHEWKDLGVTHPPKDGVKKDLESKMVQDMYE